MITDKPLVLGSLERVELCKAWSREDTHFTPWLAEPANLRLLGDAIGMELELEAQEQHVGPFRADLLCKSVNDGAFVLIENQLERTDHTHLGQLLTYAAGLDAVTIVWVAASFAEDHRAALDWLNEVPHENISFFGLEVELWRIGDSPVAPKFNVVAKPNGFSKVVRDAATGRASSEHQAFRRAYWDGFLQHLAAKHSTISHDRTPPTTHWMTWTAGHSAFRVQAAIGFRDGYTEAAILTRSHEVFVALRDRRAELERLVGEPLSWDFSEERKQNYARLRTESFDPMRRDDWQRQWSWLQDKLERLDQGIRAVAPSVAIGR